MATWIKTNGNRVEVEPKNGTDFQLEELKEYVDGYIEILFFGRMLMIVNEEGKLRNLRPNITASLMTGLTIVGNVLVCNREQVK